MGNSHVQDIVQRVNGSNIQIFFMIHQLCKNQNYHLISFRKIFVKSEDFGEVVVVALGDRNRLHALVIQLGDYAAVGLFLQDVHMARIDHI